MPMISTGSNKRSALLRGHGQLIHWSGIGRIVYALSETELYEIVGPSPEHLYLPCREVFAHTKRAVVIEGPCDQLHQQARHVHEGFWR